MRLRRELYSSKQYRKQGSVSKWRNVHPFKAYEDVAGFSFRIFVSQPACNLDSLLHTNNWSVEYNLQASSGAVY